MKFAKINTIDIADMMKENQTIEKNNLDIELKKEKKKKNEAENEYFGNYMQKIGKGVKAQDTNNDGTIDEKEKKNAVLQSGRQYGAFDKIRDDEQISANRAAAEGRAIRAERRSVSRYNMAVEKYETAISDKEKQVNAKKQWLLNNGVEPDKVDMVLNAELVDFKKSMTAFEAGNTTQKLSAYNAIDGQQAQIVGVLGSYANYKPDPNLSDEENAANKNKAGVDSVKPIVESLQEKERNLRNNGKIKEANQTQKLAEKYQGLVKDGQFNYQKGNEVLGDLTASKQVMLTKMQKEDAEFGVKKTKEKKTALEKKYNFIKEKQGKPAADNFLKKESGVAKKKPKAIKAKDFRKEIDNQINYDKVMDMGDKRKSKIREALLVGARNLEKKEPGKTEDYYVRKAKKALEKRIGKI